MIKESPITKNPVLYSFVESMSSSAKICAFRSVRRANELSTNALLIAKEVSFNALLIATDVSFNAILIANEVSFKALLIAMDVSFNS